MIEGHEFVRKALEARFPWWAIDEYQDLGYPFHRMVTAILQCTGVEVFAIGDPDQCIYETLSGTNPAYIGQLAKQIQVQIGKEPIRLLRNYRCANELIKASEVIIGGRRGYQSNDNGGICVCIECKGGHIAQRHVLLNELLPNLANVFCSSGLSMDKMAILHRFRKTRAGEGLNSIADHLDKWPHSLDKDPEYDSVSEVIEWIELLALWCSNGEVHFDELVPFWINLNADSCTRRLYSNHFGLEVCLFQTLLELRNPFN
jgi:DNA helicase-2/ATP-dependent DNA helicase PcrA